MNPVAVSQKHLLPSVPPIIGLRGGVCCKKHVWRDPLTIIGHFFAWDEHHHPHVMTPSHTFVLESLNQDVLNLSKDRSPDESGQGIAPPFYCKLRGIQRDQFRTTLHCAWLGGWPSSPLVAPRPSPHLKILMLFSDHFDFSYLYLVSREVNTNKMSWFRATPTWRGEGGRPRRRRITSGWASRRNPPSLHLTVVPDLLRIINNNTSIIASIINLHSMCTTKANSFTGT